MRLHRLVVAVLLLLAPGPGAAAFAFGPVRSAVSSRGETLSVRWRSDRDATNYFWVDRRSDSADAADTNGSATTTHVAPPDFTRPGSRRRRGWVDPPPLQSSR